MLRQTPASRGSRVARGSRGSRGRQQRGGVGCARCVFPFVPTTANRAHAAHACQAHAARRARGLCFACSACGTEGGHVRLRGLLRSCTMVASHVRPSADVTLLARQGRASRRYRRVPYCELRAGLVERAGGRFVGHPWCSRHASSAARVHSWILGQQGWRPCLALDCEPATAEWEMNARAAARLKRPSFLAPLVYVFNAGILALD
jgi:hypothetical protein